MKPLALLLLIAFAALWLYQYRPIPVDRSWWYEVPVKEWATLHGDITGVCDPVGCEGKRLNGERVRL
jgi:hypothetical protein